MVKIRAAIIDDEPFARDRVRLILAEDAEIEIVGEAGDGVEAVSLIRRTRPDLVFLDVQMPGQNGFDVLAELAPEETPVVVFLTAYERYAVKAFEAAALDYLLKPFDEERLQKAVARAKAQIDAGADRSESAPKNEEEPETGEIFKTDEGFLERVLVKKGGRVFFFNADEIEWIEAYGNYVRLHFERATHLLRETISSMETRLDPKKFARVHRSGLVNLERVRELQPMFGGRARIILKSGAEIAASRRYFSKLSKMLEKK